MGDDSERRRSQRSGAMWQRFLDLVPPERLAAPVPKPIPEPVPDPVADAKVRAIELQILKDRQAADQKIRDTEQKAQQDALDSLQRMHESQEKMKL